MCHASCSKPSPRRSTTPAPPWRGRGPPRVVQRPGARRPDAEPGPAAAREGRDPGAGDVHDPPARGRHGLRRRRGGRHDARRRAGDRGRRRRPRLRVPHRGRPRARAAVPRVRRARAGPRAARRSAFHRAFDVVVDPDEAIEQLVDLGLTRILTSGRAKTALEGAAEIRRTRERARGRIEILAGGGISAADVRRSSRRPASTRCTCTSRARCRTCRRRPTPSSPSARTSPRRRIEHRAVDEAGVAEVRRLLDGPRHR